MDLFLRWTTSGTHRRLQGESFHCPVITLSAPGRMVVEDDGTTRFVHDDAGPHRYLTVDASQIARVREAQVMLCSQSPAE